MGNARHGIRANVIMPGLMETTWGMANAAVFLVSDEAKLVTGIYLPVDDGQPARIG